MANVRLFGETSGFVELAAPNAAGNNTITLPTTGTELLASDGTGDITFAGTVTASGLTVDGTATFAVGASGTPAIAASGDANTGIYFPAADTIGFTEGGKEVGRFDSSSRLLVGTTSAGVYDGITPRFQVEGTNFSTSSSSLFVNSNDGSGAYFVIGKSRSTSVGGSGIVQNGDEIGGLVFIGADGTNRQTPAAYIYGIVDGTPGENDMPGRLTFQTTADGASVPSERMRIKQNGTIRVNMADFGNDANGSNTGIEFTHGSFPRIVIATGDATSNQLVQFFNTNGQVGNISTSGSSTSYNTSSDYRLKENVVDLDGAITRVKQLAPKRFNFIVDETDTLVDGFLAHEAQTVVPEAVTGTHNEVDDEDNPVYQGIDQSKLVPLLTAALQEAIAKIETLETANASLEARLTALESA